MRYLIGIWLAMWLAGSVQGQAVYDRKHFSVFPDYAKVVEYYAKLDTNFLRESAALYEWEKRYDGWYVLKRNPSKPSQALLYQLLWSSKKRAWMRDPKLIQTVLSPEQLQKVRQRVLLYNQSRNFSVCPVYGYDGYEQDILGWWAGKESERDERDCECLMQLYGGLVYRHWLFEGGKAGRWSKYDSTYQVSDIKAAALDSVERLSRQWHKTAERLLGLQPDYLIGSSGLASKAQNDKMSSYNDLLVMEQGGRGKPFLMSVRYDTIIVQTAMQVLNSCPQESVLFAQTEYAFYPLLYAQERLGVRKDVVLVYIPLLNVGRYIHYLKERRGVVFSLPQAHYQYQNGKIWRVQWDTTARDWANFVKTMPQTTLAMAADYALPSPRWWLNEAKTVRYQWRQPMCIQENIAWMDIIANRVGKKPVCFAMDMQSQLEQWAMKGNTRLHGLVYRLEEKEEKGLPAGQFPIDEAASMALLREMNALLPTPSHWRFGEYQQYAHWQVTAIYHLAVEYSVKDDPTLFADYLEWMYKTYPPERYWYGTGHLIFAFLLSDVNKKTEAAQHLRGFAKEIDQKHRWLDYASNEERAARLPTLRQEVGMLLRTAQELEQMELVQQYEAQFRILFQE